MYLYTILPHAPRPTSSPPTPCISHVVNGMIGAMHHLSGPVPPQVQFYGMPYPYQGGPPSMYGYPSLGKYPVGYSGQNIMTPMKFGPPLPTLSGMDVPTS